MKESRTPRLDLSSFSPVLRRSTLMPIVKDLGLTNTSINMSSEAAKSLLSPPPEETLRRLPKMSSYAQSSPSSSSKATAAKRKHRDLDGDRAPVVPLSSRHSYSRRRSSTPLRVITYEPPTEHFTPPKEIVITPGASANARRRSTTTKKKPTSLRLSIKKEMPDIDFSKPIDPPSPSDDPLLLSGPPLILNPRMGRPRRITSKTTSDAGGYSFDSDSDCCLDSNKDAIGQSEAGEYTGRFKMLTVPTKADPPTSGTRERIERWGTPRSPFPFNITKKARQTSQDSSGEPTVSREECRGVAIAEAEIFRAAESPRRDSTGGVGGSAEGSLLMTASIYTHVESTRAEQDQPGDDVALDSQRSHNIFTSPDRQTVEVDKGLGRAVDEASDDIPDDEGDGQVSVGVIRLTSLDPMAAARAAAILRMHDYDWLPKNEPTEHWRLSSGDMCDLEAGAGEQEAASLSEASGGNQTNSPGSLPEQAESILDKPSRSQLELALNPEKRSAADNTMPPNIEGSRASPTPREWTKTHWKQLDSCFTDERLALAACKGLGINQLAGVDDVDLRNVVKRFMCTLGDISKTDCAAAWTSEELLARAKALQKKQRAGNVAPPTPHGTPALPRRLLESQSSPQATCMPPAHRQLTPLSVLPSACLFSDTRPLLPSTQASPSLLAPQYSHLLEEALAVKSSNLRSASVGSPRNHRDFQHQSDCARRVLPAEVPIFPSIKRRNVLASSFVSSLPVPRTQMHLNRTTCPRLPPPPPEIIDKRRGPIETPVRMLPPKPTHPKELVDLHPVPDSKPSYIPVRKKPRRLVDLYPTPLPRSTKPTFSTQPRKLSGGSVMQLVRSFEEIGNRSI